ncbi:Taurine catabolism dioxygenase TauD/TfdA [Frankia sp. AiPs1]|uniref:TauD/TfdA dioxygenase family protein n=1 Tax=Frankia sp. AiPa1 TaxID=573492 RepID=UPI00202B6996|nr:TauD/TfdA family dioxygenase [Frankia sp. AiPa1]MCL9760055.1 TauD/TfdA family dioxygenase [Frankia sp. AiPa1]
MTTTLTCEPLAATVGAEVRGVDARQLAQDDAVAGAVLEALETYGVLVLRGLDLDPHSQVAFGRRLGQIDLEPGHHPVPGIYRVTLDTSKNASADYLRATFAWHMDGCTPLHGEPPQKATILSAKAVALAGGQTEFASTYAAYDALGDEDKARFAAIRVVHSMEYSQRHVVTDPTPEQLERWRQRPSSVHPLVWTHRDGRRSLVIGVSAGRVVGTDPDSGSALLADLLDHATAPGRVYRHEWQVGDTVIWDNTGLVHRATPYPRHSPREMLRTAVFGTEPIQ